MSAPIRLVTVAAVALVAAGCGSTDPTASDEYAGLAEERDELLAILDDTEA